ncbi:uncharacterized protein LOC126969176 [Leptidea sinapis]|uniref:uncharacterized protein LOC126969176 n=1 Tax=Leptidea sinapis TaxID=189913 RepID=UPI0021C40370|nr:uncharacterized protein LOC126969176 [Leptidea sinapis]
MFRSPTRNTASRGSDNTVVCDTVQCKECKLVVNELLAFVSNKIDTLPETGIIQICLSAYSFDEIESARLIAYKLLAPTKKCMRRRDGSEQKGLQDIIKLIKEYDPDCLPTFVAKNLNKLPPITFDHIDVTTFLKEMSILKSEVANIKATSLNSDKFTSNSDFEYLKQEIEQVKRMLQFNLQTEQSSCERSQRNDSDPKNQKQQQNTSQESVSKKSVKASSVHLFSPCAPDNKTNGTICVESTLRDSYSDPSVTAMKALDTPTNTPSYRDITVNTKFKKPSYISKPENDNFVLVEHRKRKKLVNSSGTAQISTKLRVADLTSAVYVSRVNKSTSADDIREYIKDMGEECVKVELLTQKNETQFTSYKIIVSKNKLDRFLKPDFWPEGIKFRIYRDFIPKGKVEKLNSNKKYNGS